MIQKSRDEIEIKSFKEKKNKIQNKKRRLVGG